MRAIGFLGGFTLVGGALTGWVELVWAAAVHNPRTADCCVRAPSIIELDPQGKIVQAWGGPRRDQVSGEWIDPQDGWPVEHGLFVDRGYRNPVHAVRLSNDQLLYITDRTSNRIQVFRHDGTFVSEAIVAPLTSGPLALSADPGQTWIFMADGQEVWFIRRADLSVVGDFGRGGRQADHFEWAHNIAANSRGNLYTAEVSMGKRVEKFMPAGN